MLKVKTQLIKAGGQNNTYKCMLKVKVTLINTKGQTQLINAEGQNNTYKTIKDILKVRNTSRHL